MRSIQEILAIAALRHGGEAAVLADLPALRTPQELATLSDDRWLAQFARGIFQTGISWKVVETKWPGIEEAFHGFDPGRVAMIEGDALDDLLSDPRVIRSGPKIIGIRDTAVWMAGVAREHGSFAACMADWPASDFAGLLLWLAKEGSRLGGNTGAYAIRAMGRDGFLLSADVAARLEAEGVIEGPPNSVRNLRAIQSAFDQWAAQSGLSLTALSRILAKSIDA